MLMSTASLIAAMPAATWAISRSFGPRTAATMQNSVAPVFAVCLAASTSDGTSSQAERTGESNSPDWEQKWLPRGEVTYPSLYDPQGRTAALLDFPFLPDTYVVDGAGTIRYAIYGETDEDELSGLIDDVLAGDAAASSR